MRSTPSMVFSTFTSTSDPRYLGWQSFRRHVHGQVSVDASHSTEASDTDSRPPVGVPVSPARSGVWRLLAPNNRELARSAHLYSSEAMATVHFVELQQAAGRLEILLVHGAVHGTYTWVALLDGTVVMTASRAYEGMAAARSAIGGVLAALELAHIARRGSMASAARDSDFPARL